MFRRVVQKSLTLNVAAEELWLLLPQKNEAAFLSRPQLVTLFPSRNSNEFNNIMPMVNQDKRHYTPCFILQEEHVINFRIRPITRITMRNFWEATISNYTPASQPPL